MKKLLLFSGVLVSHLYSYDLKIHERWWENNVMHYMNHFSMWLGDENAPSRLKARGYIIEKGYKSILDCPSGLGTEYIGYKKAGVEIEYYGVDITPALVSFVQSKGINVIQGSIEKLPFGDNFVDVSYARHILEHLQYYDKAIDELIRVSNKEVIIIFFMKPIKGKEALDLGKTQDDVVYHNQYDMTKLENFIMSNSKVQSILWEDVNDQEIILHIMVS